MGRRVLVTGLDSFWGGRMAQALETDPDVEMIIGMGRKEPTVALERTEFVRADQTYSILSRIVRATQVDTVVHTFLLVDSTQVPGRTLHEINVIGTMNLLAAAGQAGSPVRHLVVKSSTLVYGASSRDPYWFREEHRRVGTPKTRLEHSLVEVESLVRDFADDNPSTLVTVLRFANVLGPNIVTPISANLARRVAPVVSGFDPLLQFVEESDVVRCLEHMTRHRVPGLYNVAGDGKLPWHEVIATCRAVPLPLPAIGTGLVASPLAQLGVIDFPPELESLLRFGRGVDTSRLKQTGFRLHNSTAGALNRFIRAVRLRRSIGDASPAYTFDQDVEQFFRHSSAVVDTSLAP
ncbi:MAG: NAD-dependent epimerase/dehydratase family protein [Actinomycetota bacterium]|jgi:UDP-glucose 4-epimerase|nr:NAD-dependent epimerase/dehydratase family protein [Actinomycetota bacterium]MDA8279258.1 NAD-dependent epimerase/dehydratase family protein [Actinomycetota bacterium]